VASSLGYNVGSVERGAFECISPFTLKNVLSNIGIGVRYREMAAFNWRTSRRGTLRMHIPHPRSLSHTITV
jgi:hypothetical protein